MPNSIELFVLRYPPNHTYYPDHAIVGPNGKHTMNTGRDLAGYVAEITYIDPTYTIYRPDGSTTPVNIREIQ